MLACWKVKKVLLKVVPVWKFLLIFVKVLLQALEFVLQASHDDLVVGHESDHCPKAVETAKRFLDDVVENQELMHFKLHPKLLALLVVANHHPHPHHRRK